MVWQRGRSYSQDLRDRVLAADDLSSRAAAARFAVSVSYVIKARQRRDRTGSLSTKPRRLAWRDWRQRSPMRSSTIRRPLWPPSF